MAQELDSILISLDRDFADIVAYPPSKYKGVIALQVKNHIESIPKIVERLLGFLTSHPHMNYFEGKLILVEVSRIRVKE